MESKKLSLQAESYQPPSVDSLCVEQSCKNYFKPSSGSGGKDHDHSGKTLKTLKRIITNICQQIDNLDQKIQLDQDQNQELSMFFSNISNNFLQLSQKCQEIAKNIKNVQSELTSQNQIDNLNSLKQDFQMMFQNKKTPDEVFQNVQEYVTCTPTDANPLQFNNKLTQADYNKGLSAELYFYKMNAKFNEVTDYLDKVSEISKDFDKLIIGWKFIKSQVNESQEIIEKKPGITFQGTNQGGQIIIGDQGFDSGKHNLFLRLDKVTKTNHRLLAVGIIRDQDCEKNFPNSTYGDLIKDEIFLCKFIINNLYQFIQNLTYGCNKCLFRDSSQDQMICLNGENEQQAFGDILKDGSIIKVTLDMDNELVTVIPPKTFLKYESIIKQFPMKGKKFRFCVMWSGSDHEVSLVGSD